MKKIVKKKIIPSREIEVVKFICEEPGCNFETQTEEPMERHHNLNHTFKGCIYITLHNERNVTFRYFETENNYNLFARTEYVRYKAKFLGPGWYGLYKDDDIYPDDWDCYIHHSSKYIEDLEDDIDKIKDNIKSIETLGKPK
jgi:hypothetical protein